MLPLLSALRPWLRASLTSATLLSIGDVACQYIVEARRQLPPAEDDADDRHRHHHTHYFDVHRTLHFALVGGAIHGPFFHWGFGLLDRIFGTFASGGWRSVVTRSAAGQMTLFPLYLCAFFACQAWLEGADARVRVLDRVPTAYTVGWLYWFPANMVTFAVVPPQWRVAWVASAGGVWAVFLSYLNAHGRHVHDEVDVGGDGAEETEGKR